MHARKEEFAKLMAMCDRLNKARDTLIRQDRGLRNVKTFYKLCRNEWNKVRGNDPFAHHLTIYFDNVFDMAQSAYWAAKKPDERVALLFFMCQAALDSTDPLRRFNGMDMATFVRKQTPNRLAMGRFAACVFEWLLNGCKTRPPKKQYCFVAARRPQRDIASERRLNRILRNHARRQPPF